MCQAYGDYIAAGNTCPLETKWEKALTIICAVARYGIISLVVEVLDMGTGFS